MKVQPAHILKKLRWPLLLLVALAGGLYAIGAYRDAYPRPEVTRLIELLELKPGTTVAEIGAGKGRMTVRLAEYLGPDGHVYATELEGPILEKLRNNIASAGFENMTIVGGEEADTNLPAACCDAIFMSKVYHHFTDPTAMNRSTYEALRAGGRLAVIDFEPRVWRFWLSTPDGVPENRGGHGMPLDILIQELRDAGFQLERAIDTWWSWPEQRFCVVVRKP